jgi:hypothetical protein
MLGPMVYPLSRVEVRDSICKSFRRELAKSLFKVLDVIESGADAIHSREMRQSMGWEGGQKRPFYRVAEFPHIAAVCPVVRFSEIKRLELWFNNAVNSIERLTREEAEQGVCVAIVYNGDDQWSIVASMISISESGRRRGKSLIPPQYRGR